MEGKEKPAEEMKDEKMKDEEMKDEKGRKQSKSTMHGEFGR